MKNNTTVFVLFLISLFVTTDVLAQVPHSSLVENYSGSEWSPIYSDEFTHDSEENLLTDFRKQWDTENEEFNNLSLITNTYDGLTGKQLTTLRQFWNSSTTEWVDWRRKFFNYDANNNLESKLSEEWMTSSIPLRA